MTDDKIRILYVITSSGFGGAETLLLQTIMRLERTRYEPRVCVIKEKGGVARQLEEAGVPVVSLALELRRDWYRPHRLIAAARRFRSLLGEFQPHVIHGSLFQADVLTAASGLFARVPVRLATVHMVLRRKWPELLVERLLSPWLNGYIAVSDDIRRVYCDRLGLSPDKIRVIHNFVDPAEICRKSLDPAVKVPDKDPKRLRAVLVGRLDPQKRIDRLLAAVNLVKDVVPLDVWLVGDGPERETLRRRVEDSRLSDCVHFAGYQANAMPWIAAADVLVLSSREEGLPLAILEGMALAKPVIATAVGAVPELVSHGQTGLLVPRDDSAALAAALRQVWEHPLEARAMGTRGQKSVKTHFTPEPAMQKLESLYMRLIGDCAAKSHPL